MKKQIIKVVLEISKNPIAFVSALFLTLIPLLVYRCVTDFSIALETVGINLSKNDQKKWRKFLGSMFLLTFCTFAFFILYAALFRY